MKNLKLILLCLIITAVLVGCGDLADTGDSSNSSTEAETRNIEVSIKSNVESSGARTAVSDGDTLAMWFRSSDIEFWSTDIADGYTNLISDLYSSEDDAPNRVSVSIDLPDTTETFKFLPGTLHEIEDTTASFANTVYDVVRIDIGGGNFDFEHNGNRVSPENTVTGENSGINGNSIFLIKTTMLDAPYYVPRTDFYDTKEELIASGRSEFLAEFISSNEMYNDDPGNNIDMDGALFIPFDGIDLSAEITSVTVFFEWDITGAFDDADNDGNYEMENRYNGTCFDFIVRVETE